MSRPAAQSLKRLSVALYYKRKISVMPHIQHLYSYFLHIHKSIRRESVGDISMGELQLIRLLLQWITMCVFKVFSILIKRKRAEPDSHLKKRYMCVFKWKKFIFFSFLFAYSYIALMFPYCHNVHNASNLSQKYIGAFWSNLGVLDTIN